MNFGALDVCHFGDCRDIMRGMIATGVKVRTCVTSPPYWGLRDYGHPGQLGLEYEFDDWLANMVEVFGLVRELLTDDGTLWLNVGDSYATNARTTGIKPKEIHGQPWRLAFALQAAGWYLRQDIIWHKPNPMPESVRDRCTKAHEYLFMLIKSERYFFDYDQNQEARSERTHPRRPNNGRVLTGLDNGEGGHRRLVGRYDQPRDVGVGRKARPRKAAPNDSEVKNKQSYDEALAVMPDFRNRLSVWTIQPEKFPGAHFATFPPELVRPCVLVSSERGDVVLDPFMGSGTTAQVAQELGRHWIGCEINEAYRPLQEGRTRQGGLGL